MRVLRRALTGLGALMIAGVWLLGGSAAAPVDHGPNLWSGKWTTSTGSVAWRAFNEQDLENARTGSDAKELFDKLPCKNGPQFYRGGYAAGGDRGKIMGCGTPTNMRGRWLSNVGVSYVNGSYTIHISSRNPLKFSGTFRQDNGVSGSYTGTWSNHFEDDGCCPEDEEEPTLPDALVSLASVANGCGPGKATSEPREFDTSTYLDSSDPPKKRYTVNFREACNLHDAGYSGAKVRDPFSGKIIDFLDWSQKRVDDKFLADMLTLCRRQVSALAPIALADCRGTGGATSVGARSRYNFVRDGGDLFFDERPRLRGLWDNETNRDAPAWALIHSDRAVKASWRGDSQQPDLRGEFQGTLITHDGESTVEGFGKIMNAGKTRRGRMRFSLKVKNLDRIRVTGLVNLSLLRAGG